MLFRSEIGAYREAIIAQESGPAPRPISGIICTSNGELPSTATAALMADWIRDELAKEGDA